VWALIHTGDASTAPSGLNTWDKVPIMDIPRVVKACMKAPALPPPEPLTAAVPACGRPQTQFRFRRVLQQGANALALLEYGMKQAATVSSPDQGCID
jgi:hypothetical protein